MKNNIDPKVFFSIVAVVVVVVAVLVIRAFTAPSVTPVAADPARAAAAVEAERGQGPTEADLKRMREYNAANPGAASSQR